MKTNIGNTEQGHLKRKIYGRYVIKEHIRDMDDFLFAGTKRNVESCPYASQEEKDAKIHRREYIMRMLKTQMGL